MAKIYVITGSTSGIGKALLEVLVKDNVVLAGYRTESKKEELMEISNKIIPFYVDYSKPETISDAIDYIKSKVNFGDNLASKHGFWGTRIALIKFCDAL